MIRRVKTKKEIYDCCFSHNGNYWKSKEEYDRRYAGAVSGYYSVIDEDEDIFGKVITNRRNEVDDHIKYCEISDGLDSTFLKIYGWTFDDTFIDERPEYYL